MLQCDAATWYPKDQEEATKWEGLACESQGEETLVRVQVAEWTSYLYKQLEEADFETLPLGRNGRKPDHVKRKILWAPSEGQQDKMFSERREFSLQLTYDMFPSNPSLKPFI